jgi:cell division septation protein DedD
MNSLFEEDDREEPRSDADLTLGIGSLLSIFFGVVLICGIFFGFGYSMGRRNARATTPVATLPQTAASTSPIPASELTGTPLKPQQPDSDAADSTDDTDAAKPPVSAPPPAPPTASHAAQNKPVVQATAPAPASAKPARVAEPTTSDPSLNAVPFTHRAPLPTKPHPGVMAPLAQAPGDAPIVPGHPIMVQIAAVSRQEDAEVLAGALRKRGFNPTVHPGTTDKFFHVQVGPFTDKTQAETMKQHLLADGYNAIMK